MGLNAVCDKCEKTIEMTEQCFTIKNTDSDKVKLIIGECLSHLRISEMFDNKYVLCLTCKNELEELNEKLMSARNEAILAFFEKTEENEDLEDDGLEDENEDDLETVEMLDLYFIVTLNGDDEPYSYKYPIPKTEYAEWVELDIALDKLTELEQAIFEALHTENENVVAVKFNDDLTFPIIEYVDLYFDVSAVGIDDFQYKYPMTEDTFDEMLGSEDFAEKIKELEQSIFDELVSEYETLTSVLFNHDLTIENMNKEDMESENTENENKESTEANTNTESVGDKSDKAENREPAKDDTQTESVREENDKTEAAKSNINTERTK